MALSCFHAPLWTGGMVMDEGEISGMEKSGQTNAAENHPSVSVIVVNKDGIDFIDECLASLLRSAYDNFEVIFVDNGSIDGSPNLVRSEFSDPKLRVILLKTNVGLGEASNIGVRSSSSKYVIFLNSDTTVHPDWITQLVTALEKDTTIGIAQSKILTINDQTRIDSLGEYIDRFGDTMRKGAGEYDDGRYSRSEEIFNAVGTVTILRRDLYLKIGGFRRYFFIMHDDVDLGWRIWLNGYRAIYVPDSVVYHRRAGSTGRVHPLVTFHNTKNMISTMIQNYELSNILRYVPIRMIMDIGSSLRNLHNKNLRIATAMLRGLQWNITNFRAVWRTHEEVKYRVRRTTDKRILLRMASNGIPYAMIILHAFPFTKKLLIRYMRWKFPN